MLSAIAEGRPEGIKALKETETSEFYFQYKSWKKRGEAINKAYKKK